MGKRLLTKDYDGFVKETFTLPEPDLFNYYSNIIDDHIKDNPDIFQGFEQAINRLFDWYKSKVHGKPIWVKFNDGLEPKEAGIFSNQHWYIKDGKRILNDVLNNEFDLYSDFGIDRKIKGEFFEYQLEVIIRLKFKKEFNDQYDKFKDDFKDLLAPGKVKDDNDKKELHKLHNLELNGNIENLKKDLVNLLTRKNPKNDRIYMSETDIQYFINQNFAASEGVKEIKSFKPNMNKTELRHVYWLIYNKYHLSKQKPFWHKIFNDNFPSFQTNDISNLKDYSIIYLKR